MGSLGSKTPHAVLQSPAQFSLKAAHVKTEVAECLHAWSEGGTQLGLTADTFQQVLCPAARADAEELFGLFDTEAAGKVDALEVLCAAVMLAEGAVDEKFEALYPICDFSGAGQLAFDELNILAQSVCRGLTKVCGTRPVGDGEIVEACNQIFDAYNIPYDKNISKEQMRRWVRSDEEAMRFIEAFHAAYSMPELEAALARQERDQKAVLSQLCDGGTSVPVSSLQHNDVFRQALDSPSDAEVGKLLAMTVGPQGGEDVELERLAKTARAWNVFGALSAAGDGEVDAKELANLLWLWEGERPAAGAAEGRLEAAGIELGDRLSREDWLAMCLEAP
mmetsp:Transcript_57748/g.162889  ORF Transcript_57748/g.162889 Transcript_57748/m.162889 type:complete len:335 (-) Transcript_57748:95-1099(-)